MNSPILVNMMKQHHHLRELSYSSTPTAEELSEVFTCVDENNDGLICAADLRGFMSRVLAFEISESEAETLLLVYGNGRTLRSDTSPEGGGGAVVDVEGFLALYQCLCGEQASPEEQSMMAAASQAFDKTQLQSGSWHRNFRSNAGMVTGAKLASVIGRMMTQSNYRDWKQCFQMCTIYPSTELWNVFALRVDRTPGPLPFLKPRW